MHQAPPTAKGHHFITIQDGLGGMINIIVRPKVYEKWRGVLRSNRLLIVEGEVQRKDNVINILMHRAASMPYAANESDFVPGRA